MCYVESEIISKKVISRADDPYIVEEVVVKEIVRKYNPDFGDDRICECGHPYYRHFDTYDDMYPCGCKYCNCDEFIEKR